MHTFDYEKWPSTLLTPEIMALVGAIREYKGKQELYLNEEEQAWLKEATRAI